ncbi:hypothetical protein [Ectobacillus ponti]|uniref:Lipoprotein n=1 Tax=Ectobacillus ponti TaxID=2961894 RepID=A0AA42BQK9_9BACI|nr:hypothetical protein [Ectobacillus ponti]MCP8969506.1 hypothetical protein [Ectobacillus ponti]
MRIMLALLLLLLSGCSKGQQNVIIDWADVVHITNTSYDGAQNSVLTDPALAGEELGTVKFKMADNVKDPSYRIKNGDATFLEKGTKLYAINGAPRWLAVKDEKAIHGYHLYYARKKSEEGYLWGYDALDKKKIQKVELYKEDRDQRKQLVRTVSEPDLTRFLSLLERSVPDDSAIISSETTDFARFHIIVYTDSPVAPGYILFRSDGQYIWAPDDQRRLPPEISGFIQ